MTRVRLNWIVTLAGAGMILCWFDVLNRLVMPALSRSPLPLPQAALILIWSSFMAFLLKAWSPRRIGIVVLHLVGLLAALLLVLRSSGDPAFPFYNFAWMTQAPSFAGGVWQWLAFSINLFWAVALYYFGFHLQARKTDFRTVSNRLDIGISAFFVVLVVKLIVEHKGMVIPYEHTLGRQLVCFMMLGLFSMGVARNRTSHRNSTISYYKGAGMVLSFGLLAAVFGTGMVMLFLPDLIEGALWGKEALGHTWPWIEHTATVFVNSEFITRWIEAFVSSFGRGGSGMAGGPSMESESGKLNLFNLKMVFIAASLYSLVVLWFVVEWLLHKPEENKKRPGPWVVLRIMARRLKRVVLFIFRLLFSKRDPLHRVEQYYRLLQRWGARSGLPRALYETPNEYGSRLVGHFPGLAGEIGHLIDIFNRARYGGVRSGQSKFRQIQASWKRMRSPKLWPMRARLWLFRARM